VNDVLLMGDPRVTSTPVTECGEDLVDARGFADLRFGDLKVEESGAYAHLRRGIVERLLDAQAELPEDYRLLLVEGYRPDRLQRLYFDRYRQRLIDDDPGLGLEDSFMLASRYVSPPEVAPHVSGAAIDLTLTGRSGEEVDLGTPINATPEASEGACYFAAANISTEARHHRQVLATALTGAGLVNYPTEWWHWSFGDRYWAQLTSQPTALYGPTQP
jgi:zinc D-Ala-D-Ala dipeptidase